MSDEQGSFRIQQYRPRGHGKTEEQDTAVRKNTTLDAFVRDSFRLQVAAREEDLKALVRQAIELVEQNPRNEPMRTEISRPAVERMLAEDIAAALVPETVLARDLANKLFDAGWRPTIDRLVR